MQDFIQSAVSSRFSKTSCELSMVWASALCLCLANCSEATAMPETLPGTGGDQSAVSSEAQASEGVVYPERKGKTKPPDYTMKPGEPEAAEKEAIERTRISGNPRKSIADLVNKLAGKERPFALQGQLFFLQDSGLSSLFPRHLFYILRYRQWPVGFDVPPPLSSNNLFVFAKEGSHTHITKSEQLKSFFASNLKVTSKEEAREAVSGWLRLSQELHQDGMFQFDPPSDLISNAKNGTFFASGRVNVREDAGNMGGIMAELDFDANGALGDYIEQVSLKPGMRPICQASKLLDRDPIIRKMAEQDLLIMGAYARPYLNWQKTRLSAPLCEAIDRILLKIEEEGRYEP